MTLNEMYTAIVNKETITDEMVEIAKHQLELDAAAKVRAAEKRAAKNSENQPLVDAAVAFLGTEFKPASAVAEAIGVSTPKASVVLKMAIAQGKVVAEDGIKFEGKKTACKGYKLA